MNASALARQMRLDSEYIADNGRMLGALADAVAAGGIAVAKMGTKPQMEVLAARVENASRIWALLNKPPFHVFDGPRGSSANPDVAPLFHGKGRGKLGLAFLPACGGGQPRPGIILESDVDVGCPHCQRALAAK